MSRCCEARKLREILREPRKKETVDATPAHPPANAGSAKITEGPIFHHTKSYATCAIDTVTTNHRILLIFASL
jgi:hypothetical protein